MLVPVVVGLVGLVVVGLVVVALVVRADRWCFSHVFSGGAGGEGGIRTHGPFGQRFSRPSQSTALPPLRRSSYGRASRSSAESSRLPDPAIEFRRRIAEAGCEGEGEQDAAQATTRLTGWRTRWPGRRSSRPTASRGSRRLVTTSGSHPRTWIATPAAAAIVARRGRPPATADRAPNRRRPSRSRTRPQRDDQEHDTAAAAEASEACTSTNAKPAPTRDEQRRPRGPPTARTPAAGRPGWPAPEATRPNRTAHQPEDSTDDEASGHPPVGSSKKASSTGIADETKTDGSSRRSPRRRAGPRLRRARGRRHAASGRRQSKAAGNRTVTARPTKIGLEACAPR